NFRVARDTDEARPIQSPTNDLFANAAPRLLFVQESGYMSVLVVDTDAVIALSRLVHGPLESLDDVLAAEWIVRSIILHDDLQPVIMPLSNWRESGWTEMAAEIAPKVEVSDDTEFSHTAAPLQHLRP